MCENWCETSPMLSRLLFFSKEIPRSLSTVPCKCKLTVSTRNSILEAFESRGSRFEARVSSIEYRDARRIFRGSRWQISRKRLIYRTSNNKREQKRFSYGSWMCPSLVWSKVEVNQFSGSKCSINLFRHVSSFRVLFLKHTRSRCCEIEICLDFSYATPILVNQTQIQRS